jgi:hypothetical protein
MLRHAIRETRIETINATADAADEIKWKDAYSWILVGGQAMDRGFTVEGLTVTYMPRDVGVGNADTIQQRGRFFGYKRKYLDYCRVFLSRGAKSAFTAYIAHEEDVRNRLLAHRDTGRPLSEWKRAFLLAKELKPTRRTVLDLDYARALSSETWWYTDRPHVGDVEGNLRVVDEFRAGLAGVLAEDLGSPERTVHQRHLTARVPLRNVLESVLSRLAYTHPSDSSKVTLLSVMLGELVDANPELDCAVFFMGGERERGLDAKDSVKNFFQGASPVEGSRRGTIYPGDREVAQAAGRFALQFHRVDLTVDKKVVHKDVMAIAFYSAHDVGDLLVQEQPAQYGA